MESPTRTRIEEEVDIDSAESWRYTPKSGLGPKTPVMMEVGEFMRRAAEGKLKVRWKKKKKAEVKSAEIPQAQLHRRPWVQVVPDSMDILLQDGEQKRNTEEILADEYPILMHKYQS